MSSTPTVTLDQLSIAAPPEGYHPPGKPPVDWNADGVVIIEGLFDQHEIMAYEDEWMEANGWHGLLAAPNAHDAMFGDAAATLWMLNADRPGGWPDCTPYMRHAALQALVCHRGLGSALEALLGEPAGVHLNLTGWVSTERNWHQDGYLNPHHVGDYYAAVWIALGDVHPDSGPFQYIPGSHRWHRLMRDRFADVVDLDDPAWPKHTEDVLTPLIEAEIVERGVQVVDHLPKQGDVLIWHPRLYHRGSVANLHGAYRPSLIAHYSGVNHRQDMPRAVRTGHGGWLFPIHESGPVDA